MLDTGELKNTLESAPTVTNALALAWLDIIYPKLAAASLRADLAGVWGSTGRDNAIGRLEAHIAEAGQGDPKGTYHDRYSLERDIIGATVEYNASLVGLGEQFDIAAQLYRDVAVRTLNLSQSVIEGAEWLGEKAEEALPKLAIGAGLILAIAVGVFLFLEFRK